VVAEVWSPLLALQRATHVTLDAAADQLAELRLGAAEMNVLANLADGAARTASELAKAVGSRPTTMTSVLDRLEARGLLARRAHPRDRRALQIELTAEGRRAAAAVRRAFRSVEQRALKGLSPAAVDAFKQVLDALAGGSDER
jgi:MarR family transcriptional regulator, organic hydroperoxide resistance regulator